VKSIVTVLPRAGSLVQAIKLSVYFKAYRGMIPTCVCQRITISRGLSRYKATKNKSRSRERKNLRSHIEEDDTMKKRVTVFKSEDPRTNKTSEDIERNRMKKVLFVFICCKG
jgi:hypothetical protein